MKHLIYLWLLALITPSDANALRSTAPEYLTTATAAVHLGAARAEGDRYHVRPSDLLAIAWHESRYAPRTVTPEPGARVSCGVMTPTPQARCNAVELTVVGGYAAGASHLRVWLDVCRGDRACALGGYAGGYGLGQACARDVRLEACAVVRQFLWRSDAISRAIGRPKP